MEETNLLKEIYEEFKELAERYDDDPIKGSGDSAEKDHLALYNDDFTRLYRLMRIPCKEVYGKRTLHDDKASTAFKARTAKKLMDADPKMSWNKATEQAAASPEYEEFLKKRAFYYESWDSVSHLRNTIKQYSINIGLRLSQH